MSGVGANFLGVKHRRDAVVVPDRREGGIRLQEGAYAGVVAGADRLEELLPTAHRCSLQAGRPGHDLAGLQDHRRLQHDLNVLRWAAVVQN